MLFLVCRHRLFRQIPEGIERFGIGGRRLRLFHPTFLIFLGDSWAGKTQSTPNIKPPQIPKYVGRKSEAPSGVANQKQITIDLRIR